jgi:hypothetical protein
MGAGLKRRRIRRLDPMLKGNQPGDMPLRDESPFLAFKGDMDQKPVHVPRSII